MTTESVEVRPDPSSVAEDAFGPSVTTALEHMLAAGQQVIANRLDLLRLDALDAVRRTAQGVVLIVVGLLVACGAWFTVMALLVTASEAYASLPTRLAMVAVVNAGIGVASVVVGMRHVRPDKHVASGAANRG